MKRDTEELSLQPALRIKNKYYDNYRGDVRVYTMMGGTQLPDGLVLIHEHSDHYSLQTTTPIPLAELNNKLTQLLESLPSATREDFIKWYEDDFHPCQRGLSLGASQCEHC